MQRYLAIDYRFEDMPCMLRGELRNDIMAPSDSCLRLSKNHRLPSPHPKRQTFQPGDSFEDTVLSWGLILSNSKLHFFVKSIRPYKVIGIELMPMSAFCSFLF